MYTFGTLPSPIDERDYVMETMLPEEEYVPVTLDYRKDLPPVRNQGNQGTCSAQTAACLKEWQEHKEIGFEQHMSPQFIYNNRENQTTSGMYPRDTMKILQKIGCVEESVYPYGKIEPASSISPIVKENAFPYKIQSYATVSTIDGLKKALYKQGPCYIAFPVYNYGMQFWAPKQGEKLLGGHAVTVVGYTKTAFIIRNSWGEDWGDGGYTYYPFEQWGSHREIWSTVDDKTSFIKTPLTWWRRLINWIKNLF